MGVRFVMMGSICDSLTTDFKEENKVFRGGPIFHGGSLIYGAQSVILLNRSPS